MNSFVREARQAGVDIFRVFDSLNYVDNIKFGLDAVHAAGGVAEGTICYTGDITNPERAKVILPPEGSSLALIRQIDCRLSDDSQNALQLQILLDCRLRVLHVLIL